jgi:hypothetical protein
MKEQILIVLLLCTLPTGIIIAWLHAYHGWFGGDNKAGTIKEGSMQKGGVNDKPTTSRPEPPVGQNPKDHKGWVHLKG